MEQNPRDYQEPGSPKETGIRRAEPHPLAQKMWLSENEGKILLFPLLFHFSVSCQCFPLATLSHEPALLEPGKYSLQWEAPGKREGQEKSQGRGYLKENCPRTSTKGVKIRSHIN